MSHFDFPAPGQPMEMALVARLNGVAFDTMRPDEVERRLRERLDALGPAPRAELLHVLMLPDFDRVDRIGEFWGYPQSREFAELLIDCEEDRTLRAALIGMLAERRAAVAAPLDSAPRPRAYGASRRG